MNKDRAKDREKSSVQTYYYNHYKEKCPYGTKESKPSGNLSPFNKIRYYDSSNVKQTKAIEYQSGQKYKRLATASRNYAAVKKRLKDEENSAVSPRSQFKARPIGSGVLTAPKIPPTRYTSQQNSKFPDRIGISAEDMKEYEELMRIEKRNVVNEENSDKDMENYDYFTAREKKYSEIADYYIGETYPVVAFPFVVNEQSSELALDSNTSWNAAQSNNYGGDTVTIEMDNIEQPGVIKSTKNMLRKMISEMRYNVGSWMKTGQDSHSQSQAPEVKKPLAQKPENPCIFKNQKRRIVPAEVDEEQIFPVQVAAVIPTSFPVVVSAQSQNQLTLSSIKPPDNILQFSNDRLKNRDLYTIKQQDGLSRNNNQLLYPFDNNFRSPDSSVENKTRIDSKWDELKKREFEKFDANLNQSSPECSPIKIDQSVKPEYVDYQTVDTIPFLKTEMGYHNEHKHLLTNRGGSFVHLQYLPNKERERSDSDSVEMENVKLENPKNLSVKSAVKDELTVAAQEIINKFEAEQEQKRSKIPTRRPLSANAVLGKKRNIVKENIRPVSPPLKFNSPVKRPVPSSDASLVTSNVDKLLSPTKNKSRPKSAKDPTSSEFRLPPKLPKLRPFSASPYGALDLVKKKSPKTSPRGRLTYIINSMAKRDHNRVDKFEVAHAVGLFRNSIAQEVDPLLIAKQNIEQQRSLNILEIKNEVGKNSSLSSDGSFKPSYVDPRLVLHNDTLKPEIIEVKRVSSPSGDKNTVASIVKDDTVVTDIEKEVLPVIEAKPVHPLFGGPHPLFGNGGGLSDLKGKIGGLKKIVPQEKLVENKKPFEEEFNDRASVLKPFMLLLKSKGIRIFSSNDFDMGNRSLLGRGKFASVYKINDRNENSVSLKGNMAVAIKLAQYKDGESFTVKEVVEARNSAEYGEDFEVDSARAEKKNVVLPPIIIVNEFQREVQCMYALKGHDNILSIHGVIVPPLFQQSTIPSTTVNMESYMGLVLEYMALGSLGNLLDDENWQASCGMVPRLKILTDIAAGLQHMHSKGYIHRDLKVHNIMLRLDNRTEGQVIAKIGDFGSSTLLTSASQTFTEIVGTSGYLSPEMFDPGNYGLPSDIFAFAVVSWDIFSQTRKNPMVNAVDIKGIRPLFGIEHPPFIKSLVEVCWSDEPQLRPNSSSIHESLAELFRTPECMVKAYTTKAHFATLASLPSDFGNDCAPVSTFTSNCIVDTNANEDEDLEVVPRSMLSFMFSPNKSVKSMAKIVSSSSKVTPAPRSDLVIWDRKYSTVENGEKGLSKFKSTGGLVNHSKVEDNAHLVEVKPSQGKLAKFFSAINVLKGKK